MKGTEIGFSSLITPSPAARRGLSDRMFIEAVLYQTRTGTPWRDLPGEFGHWNAVYHRFRRWEKGGLWERLWHRFQHIDDDQLSELFIDSTVVRAHQHAAGASKKRWATSPGSGPPFATTGGFSTKLHAACTDERTGVSFVLRGRRVGVSPGLVFIRTRRDPGATIRDQQAAPTAGRAPAPSALSRIPAADCRCVRRRPHECGRRGHGQRGRGGSAWKGIAACAWCSAW